LWCYNEIIKTIILIKIAFLLLSRDRLEKITKKFNIKTKKIMTKIQATQIFNPEGDDSIQNRSIIKWNITGLFQLNLTKYNWAKSLYQVMIGNFLVPEKVKGLCIISTEVEKSFLLLLLPLFGTELPLKKA